SGTRSASCPLLRLVQPLALRRLAGRRRSGDGLLPLAGTHACDALEGRAPDRRYGHLYQGRFKSIPVQSDEHLLTVLRYIEQNAVGAGLVARAEHWRWSGLWARMHGEDAIKAILSPWPVERLVDWTDCVNAPLSAEEFGRVRVSSERGRPFGEDEWVKRTASELRLEHTIRPEGRPPKPRN